MQSAEPHFGLLLNQGVDPATQFLGIVESGLGLGLICNALINITGTNTNTLDNPDIMITA